jgi:predicted nucleotidyltransferase
MAGDGSTVRLSERRAEPFQRSDVADDIFLAVFEECLEAFEDAKVPHLLVGGIASAVLGRPRMTTDIDVLVFPNDAKGALRALASRGFDTQETNHFWLYKGFKNGVLVDVIFRLRGEIYLDQEMLDRAVATTYKGVPVRAIPPEDLIVIKAVTADEECPHHWHDALTALVSGQSLDWDYLVRRSAAGMRRVLSLLLYAQSNDIVVPDRVVRTLFALALPDE